MVKEIFDMLEDLQSTKKFFTVKLTKEDVTTKDSKVLSAKQVKCLYHYFDLNVNETLQYIHNNDYKEVSKTIGSIIREWSEASQGKGDRGFDDEPFHDYYYPYSEGDLC